MDAIHREEPSALRVSGCYSCFVERTGNEAEPFGRRTGRKRGQEFERLHNERAARCLASAPVGAAVTAPTSRYQKPAALTASRETFRLFDCLPCTGLGLACAAGPAERSPPRLAINTPIARTATATKPTLKMRIGASRVEVRTTDRRMFTTKISHSHAVAPCLAVSPFQVPEAGRTRSGSQRVVRPESGG